MRAPALQLDAPDDTDTGARPWIVLVVATLGALFASGHVIATLPDTLRDRALVAVQAAGESDVTVSASGRDLTLSGVLKGGTERAVLRDRVAAIRGIRTVDTALSVFDPQADARARRAAFSTAIAALDLSVVTFAPGSVSVAPGSERALDRLAALLMASPEFRVRVAGHTDDTGRAEVNLRLSRERARAVADSLLARGVGDEQVIAQGYGDTQPIADNATEAGRARNRRIEVSDVD